MKGFSDEVLNIAYSVRDISFNMAAPIKMKAFYNDTSYECCALLSNLMDAGLITEGVICDKSIDEIIPKTLMQFDRVHMFAGVGGWELALNIAGWGDRQIWTGSCPCQPFSSAGKGAGVNDERHLWPAWMHLIRQCRPSVVVGEQVSAAIRYGWLDTVLDDMENTGYACWAADLPAAGIGAPHLRERVWFVGRLADAGLDDASEIKAAGKKSESDRSANKPGGSSGALCNMARADSQQRNGRGLGESTGRAEPANGGELGDGSSTGLAQRERDGRIQRGTMGAQSGQAAECAGNAYELARTNSDGCEPGSVAAEAARYGQAVDAGSWDDIVWIPCTDGKWRPTQPRIFPLAYGIPKIMGPMRAKFLAMGLSPKDAIRHARTAAGIFRGASKFRTSQIKGYGNAIVPQVAAEFIRAAV